MAKRPAQFWGFFGFGGKTPFASRELDLQFLYAPSCTTIGGKNYDPRKPEVGDFWGVTSKFGAPWPRP